jgi:hypothetical protein
MVRAKASALANSLASAVAFTVTEQTECKWDLVARAGEHCIFTLLLELAPKVLYLNFKTYFSQSTR